MKNVIAKVLAGAVIAASFTAFAEGGALLSPTVTVFTKLPIPKLRHVAGKDSPFKFTSEEISRMNRSALAACLKAGYKRMVTNQPIISTDPSVPEDMYTNRADFVFTVSRDFVRSIQTPLLIAPDDVKDI